MFENFHQLHDYLILEGSIPYFQTTCEHSLGEELQYFTFLGQTILLCTTSVNSNLHYLLQVEKKSTICIYFYVISAKSLAPLIYKIRLNM